MTALVTAQLTATKLLSFEVPVAVPVAGDALVMPGASLAIAVMFFTSDCYAELYGRRSAQIMVNVGFVMNFVLLGLVWSTILAPAAPSSVDPAAFASVLGASTNVVAGSLVAYLVSQNLDVIAFTAIGAYTRGAHLWLRNIASTATSQLVDTLVFVGLAFYAAPRLLGFGDPVPLGVLVALVVGQYLLKLGLALLDTPFVYLVVGYVRDIDPSTRTRARTI
ncbi:MAG: queuosine precursor transporter [Halobacteriales archaeon]